MSAPAPAQPRGKATPLRDPSGTPEPSAWQRLHKRLWAAPDPDLVDAGLRGEWMVASIRLLIVVVLLYFPIKLYLDQPGEGARTMVLWVGVACLAEALVLYSAVMRSWGRSWIGFFSGILDVSLVTLILGIFIRLGKPLEATNDLIIFPIYFLAIGATSLRYDWRICILTGTSAVAQYLTLIFYAVWLWDLDSGVIAAFNGEFSWTIQLGRVALLVMATVLATTLVVRAIEQRSLSNRDRLTSLANRGFFDESLMRLGALAARSGESVAVAMVDIDHFKRFNDTYGHLIGDEALRTVARLIATSFRATDLMARYGGEEFAGVFPGMNMEDAHERLNALRARIEQTGVRIDSRGTVTNVTVSIGVAVWPLDGVNVKETLAIADLRLYQAKQSGRNRVVTSADSGKPKPDSPDPVGPANRPAEVVSPGGNHATL